MRKYGLQLYSVKSHMEADVAATLCAVAQMGYTMVESAGFFGKTAEEFRALCEENGLTVCSSHSSLGSSSPPTMGMTRWLPSKSSVERLTSSTSILSDRIFLLIFHI